jgi:hypothetical protein
VLIAVANHQNADYEEPCREEQQEKQTQPWRPQNHRERRVTADHIRHLACRNRLSTATGKHFHTFSYGEISQE